MLGGKKDRKRRVEGNSSLRPAGESCWVGRIAQRFFAGGLTWWRHDQMPTMLAWLRGLNALRVLAQVSAAEQIVGRERNHGACHRQLVRNVVVARRVNSTVRRLMA